MTLHLDKNGMNPEAQSHNELIVKLAQSLARISAVDATALTDSTGATADNEVLGYFTDLADTAVDDDATNLATLSEAETALDAVRGNLASLGSAALALLVGAGAADSSLYTDNSGGTVATELSAASEAITGAATGPAAEGVNAIIVDLNEHLYAVETLCGRVAAAFGLDVGSYYKTGSTLRSTGASNDWGMTIAAYDPTSLGDAAATAVTAADLDLVTARFNKDCSALAALLIAAVGAAPTLAISAVSRVIVSDE